MNLLSGQQRQIFPTKDNASFYRLIEPSNAASQWVSIIHTPISQASSEHSVVPVLLNESEAKIRQQMLQTREIINQLASSIPSKESLSD